jgi:hypothetical protein
VEVRGGDCCSVAVRPAAASAAGARDPVGAGFLLTQAVIGHRRPPVRVCHRDPFNAGARRARVGRMGSRMKPGERVAAEPSQGRTAGRVQRSTTRSRTARGQRAGASSEQAQTGGDEAGGEPPVRGRGARAQTGAAASRRVASPRRKTGATAGRTSAGARSPRGRRTQKSR